ncbi:MAG: hypothetical protein ACT4PT_10640 [Methanobacteriota archaeon]
MSAPRLLAVLLLAPVVAGCLDAGDGGDEPLPTIGFPFLQDCTLTNWGDPCTVLASPNDSPSKAEIDLVVNPTDPMNVFVASKDLDPAASPCVWSVGQVTKDGGDTWNTVYVAGKRGERLPPNPLFGWNCITDPIMVFDAEGTLYYALQAYNYDPSETWGPGLPCDPTGQLCDPATSGSAFFLARSTDGGETFPHIIPMAVGDGNVVFHDYPRMLANPATGSVHTVWNAVGSGGVNPYVVTTRDGGESVDRPTVVAFPDAPRTTFFASGFAAGSDGTLYMTVGKIGPEFLVEGFPETLLGHLAVSRDDGRTFAEFLPAFEIFPFGGLPNVEFRAGTKAELAMDNSGGPYSGRLYVVFDDARNRVSESVPNVDVSVAWTDDGGATWSEPLRVNGDPTPHDQWMPRATVGPDGALHVMFYDRRYDPTNRLVDVTYAVSTDGGATFSEKRVTATSFDGDLGVHQNGFPFIGDYNGIGAVGPHLYMGYADTRTGRAEIAVAHFLRE